MSKRPKIVVPQPQRWDWGQISPGQLATRLEDAHQALREVENLLAALDAQQELADHALLKAWPSAMQQEMTELGNAVYELQKERQYWGRQAKRAKAAIAVIERRLVPPLETAA